MKNIIRIVSMLLVLIYIVIPKTYATDVTINGNSFFIDGKPTYQGRYWNGHKIEGLLMNSRMVQGIFDDLDPKTRNLYKYPDTGEWDPNRNTKEFVDAMEEWYNHGLLGFTINLQGGCPTGYGGTHCLNSAFNKDGSFRKDYKNRLKLIIDRADRLGMVVILGYFYFGHDQYLTDEKAIIRACDEVTNWILLSGYKNVIVEVANECDLNYDHKILQPHGISKLIEHIRNIKIEGRALLVGTSFSGCVIPTQKVVNASDFILIHGNGGNTIEKFTKFIKDVKKIDGATLKPIIVNEDDHFDFKKPVSNLTVAVKEYISWGYFDYRKKDEPFNVGYQTVPVSWGITTQRKRDFFSKIKEITDFKPIPLLYKNPIMSGFHPDPSICRVGDEYYMVNSSFEWFPGIPIYKSKDLVNWKLIGYGITRPEQLTFSKGLKDSHGIFAVTIRHHNGLFYLITTSVQGKGNFYITASNPAGEWSDPIYLNSPGIDPSLFWDADGKCYYVGHGFIEKERQWPNEQGVWMQQLDLKEKKLIGPRKQLTHGHAANAQWTEGPHLYKEGNKYMLLVAEGGTEFYHAVTQFYSDSLWGPYVPAQINPILTHRNLGMNYPVYAVGHADFVKTQNNEYWMVALGKRNLGGYCYLSRETFLTPMKFETINGNISAIVNEGIGHLPAKQVRPNLPWSPIEKSSVRDDFNGDKLALEWNFLRTPLTKWYNLKDGVLTMNLRSEVADSLENPSLIAKRMDDVQYTIATSLNFKSKKENEQAGLIIYRASVSNIKFVRSGKNVVIMTTRKGVSSEIESMPCKNVKRLILKACSDGTNISFSFGTDENNMIKMTKTVPLSIISDQEYEKYNGPYIGMYASSNGEKTVAKASFDWFDYKKLLE